MLTGSDLERFNFKTDFQGNWTSCWLWTAGKDSHGYGMMRLGGKMEYTHRLAYKHWIGPIPEGLQIDHLCRTRACLNPSHLEAVTSAVNTRRGVGKAAVNARKTHCNRGHELSGENLRVKPSGRRMCISCQKRGVSDYKDRVRKILAETGETWKQYEIRMKAQRASS